MAIFLLWQNGQGGWSCTSDSDFRGCYVRKMGVEMRFFIGIPSITTRLAPCLRNGLWFGGGSGSIDQLRDRQFDDAAGTGGFQLRDQRSHKFFIGNCDNVAPIIV